MTIIGLISLAGAGYIGIWYYLKHLHQQTTLKRSQNLVFLRILVPKKEGRQEKDEESEQFGGGADFVKQIGIMTQCLEALHSYHDGSFWTKKVRGEQFFSLEIASVDGQICFYSVVPVGLRRLFEKNLTSFYPDALVEPIPDYRIFKPGTSSVARELSYNKDTLFPIKTYENTKTEPMNALLNSMAKLEPNSAAVIQLVLKPHEDGWQDGTKELINDLDEDKSPSSWVSKINPISWLRTIINVVALGNDDTEEDSSSPKRTAPQIDEAIKCIGTKASHSGWNTSIRILASSPRKEIANEIVDVIVNAFGQFSSPNLNGFSVSDTSEQVLLNFIYRSPKTLFKLLGKDEMILSSDEVASIWHIPTAKFNTVPNIKWQRFRVSPPPDNLPSDETGDLLLGYNLYRGQRANVWMQLEDRFRHLYLIGQTGTGKSVFLNSLIKQDVRNGHGVCVVDPHGDLVEDVLGWIPRERADDVIVFDPADIERPIGVNMLEADSPEEKDFIALEAMNMMIGMFGNEIFGPRIQDYFRNGVLTLMDDPNGGALTDIVRLFTDEAWQKEKIKHVKNPIVKSFWLNQMAMTGEREKKEMIPYFAAKFGSFITNELIRNIIGQTKSAFQFDQIMDEGKILLVKLSKGLVGDINSNLLGTIFVNKIQVAAMRRQKIADKSLRRPFFLYVDEFQNFITDSFESILSEARKYKLGLVIAHQYIDQMILNKYGGGDAEKIKNAVFGNVGTMMNLKIGAKDAEYMAKEMGPTFSETDLINLEGFNACIKLNINNQISRPFSMKTIKFWEETPDDKQDKEAANAFVQLSRLKYGRDRQFVGREIIRRIGASLTAQPQPKSPPNPFGM